ncbi:hypothetical protein FCV25MIE_08736 [Fagus crenata]
MFDDPFRDPCLPYLQLLPQLDPHSPQPPQLRQCRCFLLSLHCLLLFLLHHLLLYHLTPQVMLPGYGRTHTRNQYRVLQSGPARIEGVPDSVFGQLMGQRDEDFSGIWARVWAWVLGVFSEAEGAELTIAPNLNLVDKGRNHGRS